jgi:ribosomal protein S18 acetylase RimI-like enzyme
MSTLTRLFVPATAKGHLRPFDVRRDLEPVADLVEKCFADTLDPDGERYLQQMRNASHNPGFLRWAAAAAEWASVPLTGYVWEEAERIVGNISLIPFNARGRRYYLIANVGVDPDYRRRGIARSLTIQAVKHARQRGAPAAWLHVRQENDPAVALYRSLGFIERARRTTWYSTPEIPDEAPAPGIVFTQRRPQHWHAQFAWLKKTYPAEVTWHMPLNMNTLRPGLVGILYRLLTGTYVWQWSAQRGSQLLGVLAWQATRSFADSLWLAVAPGSDDAIPYALLLYARQRLSPRRHLSLDYPAGRGSDAIRSAGFYPHQTLIWMELNFIS